MGGGRYLPHRRRGRKGNLVEAMEKLPGVTAQWSEFQDKKDLLEGLFGAGIILERELLFDLGKLEERLRVPIDRASKGVYRNKEVKLGAYGLLPFAICKENAFHAYQPEDNAKLPEIPIYFGEYLYCPERVAVVGKCDCVYYYGHSSGHPLGVIPVAVVEAKIYHNKKKSHFHMRNNAILHQIWSSLIGSGATVGIVLANGRFKFFWVEEHEGKTHFFTFPAGHTLGDFAKPADREVFCEVMFHVVRCSMKYMLEPREELESDDERKVTSEQKGRSGLQRERDQAEDAEKDAKRKADSQAGKDGSDKHARKVGVFMDGSEFLFAPYDFSYWSEAELEIMDEHLSLEKKRLRERLELEAAVSRKKT